MTYGSEHLELVDPCCLMTANIPVEKKVESIMKALLDGCAIPPVIAQRQHSGLFLIDGNHRREAHKRLKRPIACLISERTDRRMDYRTMTPREAHEYL